MHVSYEVGTAMSYDQIVECASWAAKVVMTAQKDVRKGG